MRKLFFTVVLATCLFSREKIVVFPPNAVGTASYHNRDHPNPAIYVWPIIKDRLDSLGIDLVITQVDKCDPKLLKDPSVKYYCFHNFFSSRAPALKYIPYEKRLFWIWEPMTVNPEFYQRKLHANFSKVYTFDDTLVDGKRYFKYYYSHNLPMIKSIVPFENKKFCCLINSKRVAKRGIKWKDYYSERNRIIGFFEGRHPQDLDLFGKGWRGYKCARGCVGNKTETIKNYRFCICYENTNTPGYVTEKIFDCFRAGIVPVYLGASNVEKTIPTDCFVDRREFSDHESLYQFLKAMDKDTYNGYLERIRAYLKSEMGYVYTPEYFVEAFIKAVTKE